MGSQIGIENGRHGLDHTCRGNRRRHRPNAVCRRLDRRLVGHINLQGVRCFSRAADLTRHRHGGRIVLVEYPDLGTAPRKPSTNQGTVSIDVTS